MMDLLKSNMMWFFSFAIDVPLTTDTVVNINWKYCCALKVSAVLTKSSYLHLSGLTYE